MLHLLLGADWVKVREEILTRIAADVQEKKHNRILMVPELISHDTERRLCAAAGDTASRYAEVLSFPRLARRVADSMGSAAQSCMDDGGRIVAMAAATRQLHSRLKAYAAVETKPEFLRDMVDAVDEFKRCCITPVDLQQAADQAQGSLAQKLEELSLILSAYDSLCAQGKKDPRDLMNWLLRQLQDGDFGQEHVFYIDGFPDFTRQHMAILEHLIRVSPSVTVGLNCDSISSQTLAFEKAGDTASQLVQCAKRAGVDVKIEFIAQDSLPLEQVRNAMFQGQLPQSDFADCLQVVSAESTFHEVQAAAQKVMELVRGGCRYRDISVVCTDMNAYSSFLRMWFRRCGIPLYESGTQSVLESSVMTTVLSALSAALGGFDRQEVLRYLRSGLSPLDTEVCDKLENYAIIWAVRGKRWLEPWENHPGGLSELWTPAAQQELELLNRTRETAVAPLQRLYEKFREAKDLSGQVQALYAFLEEIDFAGRLSDMARQLDDAGDNRSAQILNQLWEIILNALEQLHDVLGTTSWEPEAFLRLITLLLNQYDVGTIPPVLDAVMTGPVSAMRCQQQKHLIALGAEEGKLPGYGGSTGILSDQERVALRSLGVPLTGGAMEGIQAEFAEIYGVFCGARKTVTVLYSGGQPSYVCRRLAEMAGGEERLTGTYGPETVDPEETAIYLNRWSAQELAQNLGLSQQYAQAQQKLSYTLGNVESGQIDGLYGETLHLSASQVDRQAECRMSYFLKYGMRAKERKEVSVDPAEFGTYVHAVLEQTAKDVMARGGFHEASLEQTLSLAAEYADAYEKEHFAQLDSLRLSYLLRRNRKELEMVVAELWQELKASAFIPQAFELAFGRDDGAPAIAISASTKQALLRGFVDRVDVWQEDGRNYFRVVDYKTGKKDFDYCDVFNGVGLQMLLYLFALENSDLFGQSPVGAGVQYFPARAPIVTADGKLTAEQAEALRSKEWKRKGLLLLDEEVLQAMDPEGTGRLSCTRKKDGSISGDLADREQMQLLRQYIYRVLGNMVDDIASGNIEANPYTRGTSHDACAYCPYGAICHKEQVQGRRNYKAMTAQRFWEEVQKEVHHG